MGLLEAGGVDLSLRSRRAFVVGCLVRRFMLLWPCLDGRRHTRRRRPRPTSRSQHTSLMIRGRVFPSRVLASHERTTPATARTFRCSLVVILFFSSYVFGAQPLSLQVVHVACLGVRLDDDCTSLDYLSPHLKTRLPKEPPIDSLIPLLVDSQGPLPEAQ